jgi:hypothetical protein
VSSPGGHGGYAQVPAIAAEDAEQLAFYSQTLIIGPWTLQQVAGPALVVLGMRRSFGERHAIAERAAVIDPAITRHLRWPNCWPGAWPAMILATQEEAV